MKVGLYKRMRGNTEAFEEKVTRVHLLFSVLPNNEAATVSGHNERDYDILVFNPSNRKSNAMIRQIALIKARGTSDDEDGACETRGDIKATLSYP